MQRCRVIVSSSPSLLLSLLLGSFSIDGDSERRRTHLYSAMAVATTVSFLRLPTLPANKPLNPHQLPIAPPKVASAEPCTVKLLHETFDRLQSAALPLAAVAFPFFLDTKASPAEMCPSTQLGWKSALL